MPQNKRESLIYTIMMCFLMVLWMSIYNVMLHSGGFSIGVLQEAWMGFPIAFMVALLCDWFLVSGIAKGFAFRFLVKTDSHTTKKIITISCCMVIPMVLLMSFYGALMATVNTGTLAQLGIIWITNIPKNFIMALPFQLLIAGPIARFLFRKAFPVGKVLA